MDWDITSWFVPLVFWVFVGAVILVPVYLRSRDRQRFYDTLRVAIEKGQPVAPEFVRAIQANAPAGSAIPSAERDLRMGVILLAGGLGAVALGCGLWYGLMQVDEISAYSTGGWVGGLGAIVALVGLVYLCFGVFRRRGPRGGTLDGSARGAGQAPR